MVNPIGGINGAGGVSSMARALLAAVMLDASQHGARRGGAQAAGTLGQLVNNLSGVLNAASGLLNALDDPGDATGCCGASEDEGLGAMESMARQLEGIMHMAQGLMAMLMPLMNSLKNEDDTTPVRPAAAQAAQQLQGAGGGGAAPAEGSEAASPSAGGASAASPSAAPVSGGTSSPTAPGEARPKPGAGPATAAQAVGGQGDATDQALFNEINRVRQQHGLGSLTESPGLAEASRRNNATNNATRQLDHHHGITNGSRGEITAYDPGGVASTVQGWLNSPGHRAIMLDPNMKHIGVDASGDYATANLS